MRHPLIIPTLAAALLAAPAPAPARPSSVARVHVSHDQTVASVLRRGVRVTARCAGSCGVGLEFVQGRRVLGSRIVPVGRRTIVTHVPLSAAGRRVLRGLDHFRGHLVVRSGGRIRRLAVRLGCP